MGRETARNRGRRQARANFTPLLQEIMPYSACTMTNVAAHPAKPLFVTVGDNPAFAFAMSAADRARALAAKARLEPASEAQSDQSTVYADLNWAWDPEWLVA